MADMADSLRGTTAFATEQIKAEHDRAFRDCQRTLTNALLVAGAHIKEGYLVESQQIYIARIRAARKALSDLWSQPLD